MDLDHRIGNIIHVLLIAEKHVLRQPDTFGGQPVVHVADASPASRACVRRIAAFLPHRRRCVCRNCDVERLSRHSRPGPLRRGVATRPRGVHDDRASAGAARPDDRLSFRRGRRLRHGRRSAENLAPGRADARGVIDRGTRACSCGSAADRPGDAGGRTVHRASTSLLARLVAASLRRARAGRTFA